MSISKDFINQAAGISSDIKNVLRKLADAVNTALAGPLTPSALTVSGLFSLGNDVYILTGTGAPVNYTDGDPAATGEGVAAAGSLYIRYGATTDSKIYVNYGTKAQPLWGLVTSATT